MLLRAGRGNVERQSTTRRDTTARSNQPYDDTSLSYYYGPWTRTEDDFQSAYGMHDLRLSVLPVVAAGRWYPGFEPSSPSVRCRDGDVDTAGTR